MTELPGEGESSPEPGRRWALHGLAFSVFLALSLLYLRPIWRVFGTHIAPDLGDPLFNLVILEWGAHALSAGISGLFSGFWNAPFFYPAHGVTALSDHLIGPAALSALGGRLGLGPIAAYNLLFLGSFVLAGWNTYWVLRRSGRSYPAAVLGGMVFAFAPFRWDQASHLQVLLAQWVPLVLWHFDRLLVERTWKRAGWFLLFYTLHVTGGTYLAYMIHVPLAVLLINRWIAKDRRDPGPMRVLVTTGALSLTVLAAVFVPYLIAPQHPQRQGVEAQRFGASLVSWVTPSALNRYAGRFKPEWRRAENSLFPGFLALALGGIAVGARRRRRTNPRAISPGRRWTLRGLVALGTVAFVLSDLHTWLAEPRVRASGFHFATPPQSTALLYFLVAFGAWFFLRRRWLGEWPRLFAHESVWSRGLIFSGAVSALLTFPLFFVPLMAIVPGLAEMRVSSRFYVFTSVAIAALAAQGLDWIRERWARRSGAPVPSLARFAIPSIAIGLLAIELAPLPLAWSPLLAQRDFPPVYRFLADDPKVAAVLELPIGAPLDDLTYQYFATLHHKPLVNGYSGFIPPENAAFRSACCAPVPDAERLAQIREWGVTHVVVHLDRIARRWERKDAQHWDRTAAVRKVYQDDRTIVFALLPESRVAVRAATIQRP
jgi:hypothetical protein